MTEEIIALVLAKTAPWKFMLWRLQLYQISGQ
jgi:hypothetical protein